MDLAVARDLSIILLALEGMVLMAIPLAAFYFMIQGMRKGTFWLKMTGLPFALRITRLAADQSQYYSDKITEPIVTVETKATRATGTVSGIPTALHRRSRRSKNVQ